nr:hypothetical protein [Tanacetum cinerariifolium]
MYESEESKELYGVTPPRDYAVTSYNEEMSHHTLYGVKCLQDYGASFKITKDDVFDSALRRNIGDKGGLDIVNPDIRLTILNLGLVGYKGSLTSIPSVGINQITAFVTLNT